MEQVLENPPQQWEPWKDEVDVDEAAEAVDKDEDECDTVGVTIASYCTPCLGGGVGLRHQVGRGMPVRPEQGHQACLSVHGAAPDTAMFIRLCLLLVL